ncbi:hypothetical protein HSX10_12620 [Winogradskyella undariae]|uniref:hypothetical protein n=1 Tax=Winogradskyella TaxID=286104 RepID=UPI00156AC95B|nr:MULTISPECIES: hypothetical protein [Winogradskyella]NRR92413.1 hypothetical protein [Winogradskyella undariae]QXP78444.1 hypothetical protein H0I32_14680 [Winogradskyella sp. HaHa_3_26]
MKTTLLASCAFLFIFLQSCGSGGSDTYLLNNAEGLKGLQTNLIEEFGGDRAVYGLDLTTKDHLTSEFEMATITYVENGKAYSQSYITGPYGVKIEPTEVKDIVKNESFFKDKKGKIKIKDLDLTVILENYNKAIKMIESTTDQFSNFHMKDFNIDVTNDNKVKVKFVIEGEKPDGKTTYYGERVRNTNTFQFEFKADENNVLKSTEGLEG